MARVVIIAGLPGSGKSHWINTHRSDFDGVVAPDYFRDSLVPTLRFPDSRHYHGLIKSLREGKDCVIADISFCDTLRRVEAVQVLTSDTPAAVVEWLFFENNAYGCRANIRRDGGSGAAARLKHLEGMVQKYFVPVDTEALPIWQPNLV